MAEAQPPDPPGPPSGGGTTLLLPRWVAAVLVLLVVLVVWVLLQVGSLRRDQQALAAEVGSLHASLPTGLDGFPAAPTTSVLDLPPVDAEASRRAINDAFRAVFSPTTTPEQWAGLVRSPGDLGERLAALRTGQCAGAVPVLRSVRFTSDDDALVEFGFAGVRVAEGVGFQGGAVREGGTWKVTPRTVESVLGMAEPTCVPG